MGKILLVIDPVGRCMGQKNIKTILFPYLEKKPQDPLSHLFFRKLMTAQLVPHGSAQPKDTHPLVLINRIIDTDTPLRRLRVIFVVMISMYVKNRTAGKGDQK